MAKIDITLKQGVDFNKDVYWRNSNNEPYILNGWTGKMQIRKDFDSSVIKELSTANGDLSIDGNSGKIRIHISDDDSSNFDHHDFPAVYDLELTNGDGTVVKRLLEGKIFLSREVTK